MDEPFYAWSPITVPDDPSALAVPEMRAFQAFWTRVDEVLASRDRNARDRLRRQAGRLGNARVELIRLLEERPIDEDWIKELHERATRNQAQVRGITADGKTQFVPMRYGEYKHRPNNPTRPDGSVHEYCPPQDVPTQMEQLVSFFDQLPEALPEVRAAFLHHRFTQIHPFLDGNGRVARLLASAVLLKAGLPPFFVEGTAKQRAYPAALLKADRGDLGAFCRFVALRVEATLVRLIDGLHPLADAEDAPAAKDQFRALVTPRVQAVELVRLSHAAAETLEDQLPLEPVQVAPTERIAIAARLLRTTGRRIDLRGPVVVLRGRPPGEMPGTAELVFAHVGSPSLGAASPFLSMALDGDEDGHLTRPENAPPPLLFVPDEPMPLRIVRLRRWLRAILPIVARGWHRVS